MLVLSRRVGESVMIGDNVRVTVVDSRGDQIRLGLSGEDAHLFDAETGVSLRAG